MADWRGVRVLVTGGTGFLGQHLVELLRTRGADPVGVGRSDADLVRADDTNRLFADVRPQVVIHGAVVGGGIGWMSKHPADSGRDSTLMNLNVLEAALRSGVDLFIGISSACVYPRVPPHIPFREDDIWMGYPEPINGAYGQSKRVLMDMGRAYADQHGLRCVFPVPTNLYGPGDSTDPARAHVVAGLMMRCLAQPDELVVWGTGTATRELLFVEDAAEGILAMADAPSPEPINLGTGVEIAVGDLARAVAKACDYRGELRFDRSKPDGQPRKFLDVQRASERLGWIAATGLEEGLARTAAWYRKNLPDA